MTDATPFLTEREAHEAIRSHLVAALDLAAGLAPGDYGPHEYLPHLLRELALVHHPPRHRYPVPLSARSYRKKLSRSLRERVLDRDSHQCRRCGNLNNLTIDHIVPVSKGGSNDPNNLQTLCANCNAEKGTKSLVELGWDL